MNTDLHIEIILTIGLILQTLICFAVQKERDDLKAEITALRSSREG